MGWVLLVVVGILVVFTLIGKSRGFLRTIVGFVSLALAIVVAAILSGPVGSFMVEHTGMKESISGKVVSFVDEQIADAKKSAMEAANITDEKKLNPQDFIKKINGLPLPDSVKSTISDAAKTDVAAAGHAAAVKAADQLAMTIIRGIAFVICFILAIVGVIALKIVLRIVEKLPIIHGANDILGAVLGFAEGIIVVWIFFAVVTAVAGQGWAQSALVQIGNSKLLSTIYVWNPILSFL